jgi:hypothetical protein
VRNVVKNLLLAKCADVSFEIGRQNWDNAKKEFDELIAIILAVRSSDDDDLRREITGRSTHSSSGAFGNTGFAGGCTPAAA